MTLNNSHQNPAPLAKYEEVTTNPKLFMSTLEKLHANMGTKFMIPIIGGKELDLFHLFIQVTSRGGIEKGQSQSSIPTPIQKEQFETRSSTAVIGVIDAKFESGYLISVSIGSEVLKGVLYQDPHPHPQRPSLPPVASFQSVMAKNNNNSNSLLGIQRRRRRKKCEIKRRDPSHPKPNRSGYNFFFAEQHARLKQLHQAKDRDISRTIGELWNKLKDDPEKLVYQEKALRDKERYREEMEHYRQKLRMIRNNNNSLLQQGFPQVDKNLTDEGSLQSQTPEEEITSGGSENDNEINMDPFNSQQPTFFTLKKPSIAGDHNNLGHPSMDHPKNMLTML
ncbi:hypothetical protein PIB30_040485 [Stylosanthes scabra]|uniref:HMG box domain-containing protein n=1 Tax=Stylosanthes scabra TaxID=79078 RepID=A0ABU6YH47_9FABA|nr:hypothetical protein [Stylosanthes scabra]